MTNEDWARSTVAATRVSARGLLISPSIEGDGAPKSANLLVSVSVAGHGGRLSARHNGDLTAPGRAFAVSAPLSLQRT